MSNVAGGGSQSSSPTSGAGSTGYFKTSLSGSIDVTVSATPIVNSASGKNNELSVLRVQFIEDPYVQYESLRLVVAENSDGQKVLVGAFDDADGNVSIPIQIPLEGQTVGGVCEVLCSYPGVFAEAVGGSDLIVSSDICVSDTIDATAKWAYLQKCVDTGGPASEVSTLKTDLKFFYTSAEPNMAQSNPSQSVGGFVSTSEVYPTASLLSPISIGGLTLRADPTNISSAEYLQVNDEIVKIESWNGNNASIEARQQFGTPIRQHPAGSPVRTVSFGDIFDKTFNSAGKQYRCFALKNSSSSEVAKDVKVFFSIESRNDLSSFRLCVEIPRHGEINGSVSSSSPGSDGSHTGFISSSIAGTYPEDHFVGSSIVFTSGNNSGQRRVITDFDAPSATFVLAEALPSEPLTGDNYTIEVAPAQRVRSGLVAPATNQTSVAPSAPYACSDFAQATFQQDAIDINPFSLRARVNNLFPGEVVYIWLERSIDDRNNDFENNRAFLGLKYRRT